MMSAIEELNEILYMKGLVHAYYLLVTGNWSFPVYF